LAFSFPSLRSLFLLLRSRCLLFSLLTNPLTQLQRCSFAELNLLYEGSVSMRKFVSKHTRAVV
jgi:hypothetical protein